jgi:flavin-dependent dehydrogenase
MTPLYYQVIIAGAGPAGCACAIVLNQAGFTVCLVDDPDNKTLKVGESLPGAAIRLLERLKISGLEQLVGAGNYKTCVANASAWGSEQWQYNDAMLNPEGGGWHLNRAQFDQALRQTAIKQGVSFVQGKVTALNKRAIDKQQVTIETPDKSQQQLQCEWLVDATGRPSVVSKLNGKNKKRFDHQVAAVAWLKANSADTDNMTRIKSVNQGWWYSARLPDGKRVIAFFSLSRETTALAKQPANFVQACNHSKILPNEILQQQLAGDIKLSDAGVSQLNEVICDKWLAIGDAAISFDPLSSQGIFFALYSGIRGAEAILACKEMETGEAAMNTYQQQVDNVFQANQKARQYHYASEARFSEQTYWQQRF